jgi:hypothetical protein
MEGEGREGERREGEEKGRVEATTPAPRMVPTVLPHVGATASY